MTHSQTVALLEFIRSCPPLGDAEKRTLSSLLCTEVMKCPVTLPPAGSFRTILSVDGTEILCCACLQLVHTAGVAAARFGKLDVIEHLLATTELSLIAANHCKICVFCPGVSVVGKDRCVRDHFPASTVALAHGAAAGGHLDVMKYLRGRGADMNIPNSVSLRDMRSLVVVSAPARACPAGR